MYTFTGPISLLGFTAYCPSLFIQAINSSLGCSILPVQYFYRYITVLKNKSLSVLQTFCIFCLSVSFTLLYGFNALRLFCLNEINPDAKDFGPFWFEEVPIPAIIAGSVVGF